MPEIRLSFQQADCVIQGLVFQTCSSLIVQLLSLSHRSKKLSCLLLLHSILSKIARFRKQKIVFSRQLFGTATIQLFDRNERLGSDPRVWPYWQMSQSSMLTHSGKHKKGCKNTINILRTMGIQISDF